MSILAVPAMVGCKKTNNVGINVLPQGDKFNLYQTDSFDVETYTVSEDSLRTENLTLNAIGQLNDPVFGRTTCSAILQTVLITASPGLGSSPKYDSVVLTLPYSGVYGYYGDTASTQSWNIYQLNQDLSTTSPYYSNANSTLGALVGQWTGHFEPSKSIPLKLGGTTSTYIPHLRIKLDDNFGKSILANTAAMKDHDSWLAFMKGLVIVPQNYTGIGCIGYFYVNNAIGNLSVYCNDSVSLNFSFGSSTVATAVRVSRYQHDYAGSTIAPFINQKTNNSECYVQSMAGTKLWISIKDWTKVCQNNPGSNVGVQGAELFLKAKQGTNTSGFEFPDKLLLVANDSGRNSFIFDRADAYITSDTSYSGPLNRYIGGYYDPVKGGYTFHLGRHMQKLFNDFQMRGTNNDHGFYVIIPTDNPMTASRLVLDTNKKDGIKFTLTYTLSK